MARYGYESKAEKSLIMNFWLTIGRWDNDRQSVRVTAEYPKELGFNEVTMNLKMKVPTALFMRPSLVANIEIGSPAQPVQIDMKAVAAAVRQAIGMDVQITVAEPEKG